MFWLPKDYNKPGIDTYDIIYEFLSQNGLLIQRNRNSIIIRYPTVDHYNSLELIHPRIVVCDNASQFYLLAFSCQQKDRANAV